MQSLKFLVVLLLGFSAPQAFAAGTIGYLSGTSSGAATTTFSITNQSFEDAVPSRLIVVTVGGFNDGNMPTVTVGGVSATRVCTNDNSGVGFGQFIYVAAVPNGTAGDIIISKTGDNFGRIGVGWWRLTGYDATVADCQTHTNNTSPSSNPATVTLTVPAGGAVIAAVVPQGSTGARTTTWTNATERFDVQPGGNTAMTGADGTATNPTATFSGTTDQVTMAAVSFTPTPDAAASVNNFWDWFLLFW